MKRVLDQFSGRVRLAELQAFLREARERGHFSPNCLRHGACGAQNVQGIDLWRAGRWSSGAWRKYPYLRKEEAQP